MAPKVRVGVDYEIFYGLSKALNVGRRIRVAKKRQGRLVGTITSLDLDKGFGFIRGGAEQLDYYFKLSEFQGDRNRQLKVSRKVSFEVEVKYTKLRAKAVKPA